MSYVKAGEVLPEYLVEQIQEYVDGQLVSIPGKNEKALSWGEIYFLPEKRIRGIIYEYESSKLNNGGFNNE